VSCGYGAIRSSPSGQGINCGCYRNNDVTGPSAPLGEMDGMTAVFHEAASVQSGTHHMKIVIADVGDDAYDSNVLIRCGSLATGPSAASIDFDTSGPIVPGASLTLTPELPDSVELRDGATTQRVPLQSATFHVTLGPRTGKEYEPMTMTAANGTLGACTFDGVGISGATFALANPGDGRINYDRGAFFVEMSVLASAPPYGTAKFLTYTSGVVLSPTKVRLFMDGGTVSQGATSSVPALSGPGFILACALLLLVLVVGLRFRRRGSRSATAGN